MCISYLYMYICIHPVLSCIIFSKPVLLINLRRNLPKMVYILNPRMKLGKNTVCSAFFLEVLEAIAMRNFSAFELHIMICHLRSLPAVGMGRIGKLSALLPVENVLSRVLLLRAEGFIRTEHGLPPCSLLRRQEHSDGDMWHVPAPVFPGLLSRSS